jgi:DNA-binding transcriptional MerR regulator
MTIIPAATTSLTTETKALGPLMRIGEVAQQTGIPIKTIRFYCDQGLLVSITRSDGGFRLFDQRVFDDLALIRTLKYLDTPLKQIHELLQSRRSGICHCNNVKNGLEHKILSLENQIKDLTTMRNDLQALIKSWQTCGGIQQDSNAD